MALLTDDAEVGEFAMVGVAFRYVGSTLGVCRVAAKALLSPEVVKGDVGGNAIGSYRTSEIGL